MDEIFMRKKKTEKRVNKESNINVCASSSRDKKLRILHIDDDSNCLIFTKRFLEKNDPSLEIVSAESLDESLSLIEKYNFDCVISDFVMPTVEGIELKEKISVKGTTPFIFYTGKWSPEDISAAFAAGVNDFIQKEVDPSHYQVLAKRIRNTAEKHMIESMLAKLDHDLRSPLQNIKNATFLLTQSPEDSENLINIIDNSVDRVLTLLKDLR